MLKAKSASMRTKTPSADVLLSNSVGKMNDGSRCQSILCIVILSVFYLYQMFFYATNRSYLRFINIIVLQYKFFDLFGQTRAIALLAEGSSKD